jgi:4-hydroxybenzoate polyprenyltransferase
VKIKIKKSFALLLLWTVALGISAHALWILGAPLFVYGFFIGMGNFHLGIWWEQVKNEEREEELRTR